MNDILYFVLILSLKRPLDEHKVALLILKLLFLDYTQLLLILVHIDLTENVFALSI